MFNSLFNKKNNQSNSERQAGVLRVVGDRAAGKTTYMAALARWPNASPDSPVQSVIPANEDGEELINKAQDILEQGETLLPTGQEVKNIGDVKDYRFTIVLKKQFTLSNAQSAVYLDISCKDYPGEFFSDQLRQTGSPLLRDYLNDCLEATGILFLLDGIAYRKDSEYTIALEKFLAVLNPAGASASRHRIALVLSKCDMEELWVNRHRPKFLAEARFPQVCKKLEAWQQLGSISVEYFTASAFGMLGTKYQRANSQKVCRDRHGVASRLEDTQKWRPFGLVSPIYWLCTGKRHKNLDED